MNIATYTDERIILRTLVMLTSLCNNYYEHINLFLIHGVTLNESIELLVDSLNKYDISIISISVDDLAGESELTPQIIAEVIGTKTDKALFLGSSLIVNGSISNLYNYDIENMSIIKMDDMDQVMLFNLRENDDTSKEILVKCIESNNYCIDCKDAYDKGISIDEIKEKNNILTFCYDEPWSCKRTHNCLEMLWWEYAFKTPLYREIMENFLNSAFFDNDLEEEAIRIRDEGRYLAEVLKKAEGVLRRR